MPEQSDAAAERSAHVVRGSPNIAGTNPQDLWPVAEVTPGRWQLRAVAERDADIARLRDAITQAAEYLRLDLFANAAATLERAVREPDAIANHSQQTRARPGASDNGDRA
jgi:hypothetical protein